MDIVQHFVTFVRIADSGSITRAAHSLALSVPMASRHLRALEAEFGATLMRRTTRKIELTEAGAELLVRARRLLAEIDEAHDALRPTQLATGLVTISVPVSFGLAKLAPAIPKLLAKHPQLLLDVRFDDRRSDLVGDGIDLAIRVGVAPPNSPYVVARRLGSYERILCAAPTFLKKRGAVKRVEDLAISPCIILGTGPSQWNFETPDGPKAVVVDGRLRSNNVLAARDAAVAGLGVAQVPTWLVASDLREHRLVRILEGARLAVVNILGLVHLFGARVERSSSHPGLPRDGALQGSRSGRGVARTILLSRVECSVTGAVAGPRPWFAEATSVRVHSDS